MLNRKHTRREFMATAAAGLTLASMTERAYSSGTGTSSTSAFMNQNLEPAELRFYFGANPQEAEARQKIIDAFQEKYPQITISPQLAVGDPVQELQVQFAGGDSPDVIMAWTSYASLAARGIFADLNEFIEADEEHQSILETDLKDDFLGMFQMDGSQFVLPEQYTGVVLYYNKDLFEEAGVKPPPADWSDPDWTFDRFLETAQALTKEDGGRISQFGFADAWWPPLSAFLFGVSNGGQWFDQYIMPTQATVTDPKIMEGVQWYADLANVHHVMPNAEESATQAGPDMFMGGRAAMALSGHWIYPAFSSVEGLNIDVGALPAGPGGDGAKTNMDATGLAISATTEYPQHAWEFVKFCTGPEGQSLIAESGLFVPVLTSAMESAGFTQAHESIDNEQVFVDGMDHGVQQPVSPVWNEIVTVWQRETEKVLQGSEQATDVFPAMEEEINTILGS